MTGARDTLPFDRARAALADAWRLMGVRPMGHQEAFALTMLTRPIVRGVGEHHSGLVMAAQAAATAWTTLHGDESPVLLLAGTGRAAAIRSMTMGKVHTLHAALEYDARRGTWGRHAGRPLQAGLVVLADSYMLDEAMLMALVKACPDSLLTMITLPGEESILPSFGCTFRTDAAMRSDLAPA